MKWSDDLPDVSSWQPRSDRRVNLSAGLMITCQAAQARIVNEAENERKFNIDNYDSGPGVEDIVRQELSKLLPRRYCVDAGVVNDQEGKTAGGFDIVVRDQTWTGVSKLKATLQSRRSHFPFEAIYAAVEVKQTLGFKQLDAAMEKLVTLARLFRPQNPFGHITENQHLNFLDKENAILNPLHTTVFGTRIQDGIEFTDISRRFDQINAHLNRDQMVTMLCILDQGTTWYSVKSGNPYNATFMTDRQEPLRLQINHKEPENAFYRFFQHLSGHLSRSVLGLGELSAEYGPPPPERRTTFNENALYNRDI